MELMLEILWARKALAASFESSLEVVRMLMRIVRMLRIMMVVMLVNQVLILVIPTWTRCSW